MNRLYLLLLIGIGFTIQRCTVSPPEGNPREILLNAGADTIVLSDSMQVVFSHNTLVLERTDISDISAISEFPDIRRLDISYTPTTSLEPLLSLENLEYLDISGCTGISDISVVSRVLDPGGRLYCFGIRLEQSLIDELTAGGVSINPPHHYIAIGHPRLSNSVPPRVYADIEQLRLDNFDLTLLGGDLLGSTSVTPGGLDYCDSLFDLDNPWTLWAPGNHDYGNPESISMYTKRPLFYYYVKNRILFINFDTQESIKRDSSCDIAGAQLEMVLTAAGSADDCDFCILNMHKVLYMYDGDWLEDTLPEISNGGPCNFDYCTNPNNFYADIYPVLAELASRGIGVICFAGDFGNKVFEFEYTNDDGIHFLGSGMGDGRMAPGETGKVLVFSHDVPGKKLTWQFVPAITANDLF
jgi:hypothetical protein